MRGRKKILNHSAGTRGGSSAAFWRQLCAGLRIWLGIPGAPVLFSQLEWSVSTGDLDVSTQFLPGPNVVDGLDSYREIDSKGYSRGGNDTRAVASSRVIDLSMPVAARIRVHNHSLGMEPAVFQQHAVAAAVPRSIQVDRLEHSAGIRALPVLRDVGTVNNLALSCFLVNPEIREATVKMRSFPHVRRGIPANQVPQDVCESFLREACELKEVEQGKGEILAVFRHVPVALISRVRYLGDRGVLLYTVAPVTGPLRTRLHDLAAVRDRAKGTTCLVVHRTRYGMARLS